MKMTKRSGGPKTVEGKAVASRNSLKTGAYAKLIVLPGEDETEFQQLEDQFVQDFSPQDIAEAAMVRELAAIVWKRLRLERLDRAASLKALNGPVSLSDYRQQGFNVRSSAEWFIDHLDVLTEDYIKIQQTIHDEAIQYLGNDLYVNEIEELKIKSPNLYHNILVQAEKHNFCCDTEPSPADLAALEVVTEKSESISFVRYAIDQAYDLADDALWAYRFKDRIIETKTLIKEKRLLSVMQMDQTRRVHDDLSRIFFRTLSELRKHQNWRLEKNTVDITPKPPAKT